MPTENFIHGQFVRPSGARTLPSLNPSDLSDRVAEPAASTADDVSRAVAAAGEAFPAWRKATGSTRAEALYRWSGTIQARSEDLAQAIAREVGKPIAEARGEVGRCVVILRYYAGEAVRAVGEVVPALAPGALQFSLREPLGVVGLITPWNFPVAIPLWKAAPAMAFGNAVVVKVSEHAPLVSGLLAETAAAAELPPGLFNVVLGDGEAGGALAAHQAVKAISFTGSAATGAKIAAVCAARNAKFQTEMGGKNVAIVLRDADLDQAASLIAGGAMRYAGQKCTATSRVVVDRSVEDELWARLREQIEALPLGPVTDPKAAIGPLISTASLERTHDAVRDLSPDHQASVPVDWPNGCFFGPTMFRGVDPADRLAQDELFAPVLAILVADGLDEALHLANATPYGLSASLFTKNLGDALRYIHRIEAGMVRVNGDTTGVDPHAPFGGVKGSSSGTREQGRAAIEFYTETKTVQINP